MKCVECGQAIGADLHPRVHQAAQVAAHSIMARIDLLLPAEKLRADVEEIIVTTLELAGLTEPKAP